MSTRRRRTSVDRDVLVGEIASPISRFLFSQTQLNSNLQILHFQNIARSRLVNVLRFTILEQEEFRGSIGRHERDGDEGRIDREGRLRVTDGAEDSTPVCIFTMERTFDECRSRNRRSDLVSSFVGRCALIFVKKKKESDCYERVRKIRCFDSLTSTVTLTNFSAPSPSLTTS